MKLPHPEIVHFRKGNLFTSVCSGVILNRPGVHFKMKLLHPEMVPLSVGEVYKDRRSGIILK